MPNYSIFAWWIYVIPEHKATLLLLTIGRKTSLYLTPYCLN